jgi:hypothetical protein
VTQRDLGRMNGRHDCSPLRTEGGDSAYLSCSPSHLQFSGMPTFSRREFSGMHPLLDAQAVAAIQQPKDRESRTGSDERPVTQRIEHVFPLRSRGVKRRRWSLGEGYELFTPLDSSAPIGAALPSQHIYITVPPSKCHLADNFGGEFTGQFHLTAGDAWPVDGPSRYGCGRSL